MRLLFSSIGLHGHTYPLLPLAAAARRAGHDVVFATHERFGPLLRDLDIEAVTAGMDVRRAFAVGTSLAPPTHRDVSFDVATTAFGSVLARAFFDDLTPLIDTRAPDLVVYEIANIGAGLAARTAGVPVLCHGFGRLWRSTAVERTQAVFGRLLDEMGLDFDGAEDMLLGHTCVDICPPSVQWPDFVASGARIPLRPVPFGADTGEVPDRVCARDEPLVYLTLGTAYGDVGVLRTAIDGLAALDAQVLVAGGPDVDLAAVGAVPENVELRPWVHQARIVPHADLVVHHGGSGTMLTSFWAGVPQLTLPQGSDQFSNADAVVGAGLGARLSGEEVTAKAIGSTAQDLLADDAVATAAAGIATEVASMPAPEDVVGRLPELIARPVHPRPGGAADR